VLASAAAGIAGPIDSPYVYYRDQEGLRAQCELGRSLGLTGKACIHPAQIDIANQAFSPSAEELEWAAQVVEAFERVETIDGVVAVDGEMIDRPVVARALALLGVSQHRKAST
jgi:citrate lyase beta subunit